jgi:hypothetical protein
MKKTSQRFQAFPGKNRRNIKQEVHGEEMMEAGFKTVSITD